MSRLFEISNEFEYLFDLFDDIENIEPDINENGELIDDEGNVVLDLNAYHESIKEKWFDELVKIEEDFEIKAENVAQYIKNLNAEIEALSVEEKKLAARRKQKQNKVESMKQYLINCMNGLNLGKIDTAKAVISIRSNSESVKIDDEKTFNEIMSKSRPEFYSFEPKLSKTKLKKALKSGEKINGAVLCKTQSVIIK